MPIYSQRDAPIPASGIAVVSLGLRSQFLDGLTPADRDTILVAATRRQFVANSVITNQGHPADHFFVLTEGLVRVFFVTEGGKKLLFQWFGSGDLFGARTILSVTSSYLFSTETVTNSSVLVWDRPTIRDLVKRSQVARERVVNCVRLRGLASCVPHKFSLLHGSAKSCSNTGNSCPHYRQGNLRWR